jgi:hypothetical protein
MPREITQINRHIKNTRDPLKEINAQVDELDLEAARRQGEYDTLNAQYAF